MTQEAQPQMITLHLCPQRLAADLASDQLRPFSHYRRKPNAKLLLLLHGRTHGIGRLLLPEETNLPSYLVLM
jgi:hypothetical protein